MMKTAVVLGPQEIADKLVGSGQLNVLHSPTTSGFHGLIKGPLQGVKKSDLVYLVADNLTLDAEGLTLDRLVGRMSTSGYHVVILGYTAGAEDLVRSYPAAGLLAGPFDVNTLLAAVAGKTQWDITPVEGDGLVVDSTPDAGPAQQFPSFDVPDLPAADVAADELNTNTAAAFPAMETSQEPAATDTFPALAQGFPALEPEVLPSPPSQSQPEAPTSTTPSGFTNGFGAVPEPVPAFEGASASQETKPQGFGPAPVAEQPSQTPTFPAFQPSPPPASGFGPPQDTQLAQPSSGFGPPQDTQPAQSSSGFGPPQEAPPTQPPGGFGPAPTPSAGFGPPASSSPASSPFSTFTPPPATPNGSGQPSVGGFGPATSAGPSTPQSSVFMPQSLSHAKKSLVIAVAAPKGGVGKTTLTINLAAWTGLKLQSQGKRVAVIDANYQQADVSKILGRYSPTLNDLARDPSYQTKSQIRQHMAQFNQYNLDAILGPNTPEESNPIYITPALYNNVTNSCRELYDIIFIDCPVAEPHLDLFQEYILRQADYLVMPINPSQVTLGNARLWLGYLNSDPSLGVAYDANKVGIVLNQAQTDVDVDATVVRQTLPKWRFLTEIKSSKEWIRASNNNELVAAANYADVNTAFSHIMYDITRDETFNPDHADMSGVSRGKAGKEGGILSRLMGGLRR